MTAIQEDDNRTFEVTFTAVGYYSQFLYLYANAS